MKKTLFFYIGLGVILIAGLSFAVNLTSEKKFLSEASAQTSRVGRNLQVLTQIESKEELQKMMEGIADALGVKCNHCHNVRNYASDEKETKKKARVMMKMVMTINRDFINWKGANKINCYICHRGQAKPQVGLSSK